MTIQLRLFARDVTRLPSSRPATDPSASPERSFSIEHGIAGYALEFDSHRANVPVDAIQRLYRHVSEANHIDWQYSSDTEIQSTFRPLRRITQCINSTPSYQLFLAGFHIGDLIGLFNDDPLDPDAIADEFRALDGNQPWPQGKRGRLFILPDGFVTDQSVKNELIANGKLFEADLYIGDNHHVENKLCVPYATPIGFNTSVQAETESEWRRISSLVRRNGG